MAQGQLPADVPGSTDEADDSGCRSTQSALESVVDRELPRLVQLFVNMLHASGFRGVEYTEELEGDEYALTVTTRPDNEHTFHFTRGVAIFQNGKLLSIE